MWKNVGKLIIKQQGMVASLYNSKTDFMSGNLWNSINN